MRSKLQDTQVPLAMLQHQHFSGLSAFVWRRSHTQFLLLLVRVRLHVMCITARSKAGDVPPALRHRY